MTTDRELHDILTAEADAPARPAPWDDIVRRGRHRRRVTRVRAGMLAGGLAVLAVIGAISATGIVDDENTGVVADDPDGGTGPTTTRDLGRPENLDLVPDLVAARAYGNRVTLILGPAVPDTGFDPCDDLIADVTETEDAVTMTVGLTFAAGPPFVRCQSSPFSGFGTVELEAPLGSRRLIDAKDGVEIEVVDESDLLFPTELPAPFDIQEWDEFGQVTPEELTIREREWTFSFTEDDLVLNVSWWSLDGAYPDGCTDGETVDVRGSVGNLCINQSSSILSWVDGASIRVIEFVNVSSEPLPDGVDLVAIANSLGPLG